VTIHVQFLQVLKFIFMGGNRALNVTVSCSGATDPCSDSQNNLLLILQASISNVRWTETYVKPANEDDSRLRAQYLDTQLAKLRRVLLTQLVEPVAFRGFFTRASAKRCWTI